MLVLAVGVCLADKAGSLTSVRMTLHNLLSPGRLVLTAFSAPLANQTKTTSTPPNLSEDEVANLQNALLQNELQRRQLLIENARLHNQVRSMKRLATVESVTDQQLVDFVGVRAKVLSRSGLPNALTEAFIDAGKAQGLQRSQLVVDGTGLLLDKGLDSRLAQGQKVAHGTAVVGRIAEVSQWVGLVQPLTHVGFSAAVQIVKLAPQGAAYGAKGMLEGTGESNCRISGIPYTEAVAVGDEVFSADIDVVQGPRLYYGKVVHAEFSSGGQWDIRVEPAFRSEDLTEVTVVQQQLNRFRTSASTNGVPGTEVPRQSANGGVR